ncbi:hypothetical protein [Pseudofrankia asymbiotica]|uniref:Aldehyde dehydrogenase domain-containing protein n=1 Tax=Pseudofrankia asymbiotica TaxID=1834516 RepID=A0A1V2I214_9ACTN|nr:hypothetical protein [Pseudofrankia asymbiotica]ONH24078.1 hypothetical protein BL253_31210 [Pseudofrankia asymbiotica]
MTIAPVGPEALAFPFLSGGPKKLLIGGEWVEPASGRTITSVNPSTGEAIAELAEGDATDVDRAVSGVSTGEMGEHALDSYLNVKSVWIKTD